MWPVKYLRWVAALLNVAMVAATPIDGGHYFSDVIAGTAVAILCWMAAARILYASQTRPEPLATIQYPPSIVPDAISHPETAASSRKLESV
jgi:membrane-associated phospholipid phosphatase